MPIPTRTQLLYFAELVAVQSMETDSSVSLLIVDRQIFYGLIHQARELIGYAPPPSPPSVQAIQSEATASVALDGDTRPLCAHCDGDTAANTAIWYKGKPFCSYTCVTAYERQSGARHGT